MKLIGTMAMVACLALVLTFSLGADKGPQSLEGKPAPTFNLETTAGKDFNLAKEKGNVVLLDFWATWCPPCRESLPHLQKIHEDKELADKGLKVVAVNLREDKEKAKSYADENKLTFMVALDKMGAVAKKYLVSGIPTTVVVGRDGKVKKAFVGFGGDDGPLRAAVTDALAEDAPAKAPTTKPANH